MDRDILLFLLLPLTVNDPSLSLTQFCVFLKTMQLCRACETLPQHLCDSKDCCVNASVFTFFFIIIVIVDYDNVVVLIVIVMMVLMVGQLCAVGCRSIVTDHESEGTCDSDELTHLLHRYLRFDDEMLQVAVQWRECFQLIEQYNDEQVRRLPGHASS